MTEELLDLIIRLKHPNIKMADVIEWGAPIISFGDFEKCTLATVGINPSNREFMTSNGVELDGAERRFHTLNSLGLQNWSGITKKEVESIADLCVNYFYRNPYDTWFKKLDFLISGTSKSFYFPSGEACHLDLIPYATSKKWADLTPSQKKILLDLAADTLGLILRNSKIEVLILNGQSVVNEFERLCAAKFAKKNMSSWTLVRPGGKDVTGYAYEGKINVIAGINLKRELHVLGYNHNIQSSYGITTKVQNSIRAWIMKTVNEISA